MTQKWFIYGELVGDIRVRKQLQQGNKWQLYETNTGLALFVLESLHDRWVKEDWIGDRLFNKCFHPKEKCLVLACSGNWVISLIGQTSSRITKELANGFCRSLQKAHQDHPDAKLNDALFIEKYGLLLPTYTDGKDLPDDVLIGKWVSGGVEVSIEDAKTIARLNSVLSEGDIKEITSTIRLKTDLPKNETKQSNLKKRFILPGRPELETFFNDHIVDIVQNPELYTKMGIYFPGAVLLYGPPGCGKTFAVEKLVKFLGWPYFIVSSGTVGSPYIHETSKKIAGVFQKAMDNAPSVVVIDEMEAYLMDRTSSSGGQSYKVEEVAEFLRLIPEATKNKVLVFGMTNLIDRIDPAILRRGRFDHLVEVGYPSKEEILQLLDSVLIGIPISSDVNLNLIANNLQGRTLSDVTFVTKEAGRIAAKNKSEVIRIKDFKEAIDGLPEQNAERNPIGFLWS